MQAGEVANTHDERVREAQERNMDGTDSIQSRQAHGQDKEKVRLAI